MCVCNCVYVHEKMHSIFLSALFAAVVLQSHHVQGMAVVPRHQHHEEFSKQALQLLKNNDDICESHRNYREAAVEETVQVQKDPPSGATDELKIIIHHHDKKPAVKETNQEAANPGSIKRSADSSEENEHLSTFLEEKIDPLESNDKYPKTRSYQESVIHHQRGNRYDRPSNGNLEVFLGGTSNDDSSEESGYVGREWQYQEFGNPGADVIQEPRPRSHNQNRQMPLKQRSRPVHPEYRAEGDANRYRPRVGYPQSRYEKQEKSGYRAPDAEKDEYVAKRKSGYRPDDEEKGSDNYASERRQGLRTRVKEERTDVYAPKIKSGYRTQDHSEEKKGYEIRKKSGYVRYENRDKKPNVYEPQKESGYKSKGNYGNKKGQRDDESKEKDNNYGKQKDKDSSEENSNEDVLVKISVNNDQDSPDVGKVKIDVKKDRDLYPDERQLKISVKKDKDLLPADDRDLKIEVKNDCEQEVNEEQVKTSVGEDGCESEDDRTIFKVQKPRRKCCKKRKSKSSRKRRY